VAFFVAAAIATVLAVTSGIWLSALPTLFGAIEANSELIGALADLTQIVTFVMLVIGAVLAYLGFRNLRNATAGVGVPQAVNLGEGGRGTAVGGDINRGAVVVGDHNRVEVFGDITYNYRDVAPSPVDAGTRESARRQLEAIPLEEVPNRSELPSGSVMPLRPNRYFVGREEQLKMIASNLKAGGAASISEMTVAASSGLGGIGKTQLASEFVHRYGRYFHGVYWVSFANPDGIHAEIASCGGTGGMNLRPDFHTFPLEERVRAVLAEWQGELPRLLVFDNCEHEGLLDRWLPPTGGCRVLVTSRRGHWDPSLGVIVLPLDVFSRQESVALLREHRPDLPADSPELDAIAEELGDLPLALDLAGRYLKRYRREVTPAAYLLEIRRPELLEHPSLRRARGVSSTKHDMDVWRTFALSYWQLNADDETDRTVLSLLARATRLAPGEPITGDLLEETLEPPNCDDDLPEPTTKVRDALDKLTDLGLLEESGEETLRMHRLVAAFALAEVPDDGAQAAVEAACALAAGRAFQGGQPATQEALLPHVRFVTDSARGRTDAMEANLCTALNASLSQLRAYDEALPYAERAWEISVELYGPEHHATLQRRSNIGEVFEGKGDRIQARAICEEVLEAQGRVLGQEAPDVAATLNNLGASFVREDLYHETLSLYRRALHIREAVWERTGPDDPDRSENAYELAESYSNMGALLMDLGRHGEARPYLTRAAEILADEVGLAHERNATTLIRIGRAVRAEKDYPLAATTLRSALAIYENISVRPPPVAVSALSNLGAVLAEWTKQDGALSALQRAQLLEEASGWLRAALNGFEQMHGEWYPATGGILRALAGVCDAQGYTEDGHHYRGRAEANRRANLEPENADAASVLNRHGTSLIGHGLYDEAHAYLDRALRIREITLGEWDFDTSTSLLKLGVLLQLQGRTVEARLYLERARDVRASICGETHPATELIRDNLILLDS
jgi:tetratricopeptide (TPR) repeat protein